MSNYKKDIENALNNFAIASYAASENVKITSDKIKGFGELCHKIFCRDGKLMIPVKRVKR